MHSMWFHLLSDSENTFFAIFQFNLQNANGSAYFGTFNRRDVYNRDLCDSIERKIKKNVCLRMRIENDKL